MQTIRRLAPIAILAALPAYAQTEAPPRNDATATTAASNAAVLDELPFADTRDAELVAEGFIAGPDSDTIRDAAGRVVWRFDGDAYSDAAPDSVNPSLWRQSGLNAPAGLYRVADGIYQVRGYDLSNLSVIVGTSGYIVVDPLISKDVAAAAMQLVYAELGRKPVVAVIYSHSHADHFGGVKGVVSAADVAAGRTRIFAPEGFAKFAVSENVLAGNAMSRRASYMFGTFLPRDPQGNVGAGLGQGLSGGEITLLPPTDIISGTSEPRTIDGVEFVFMNTPYAEAPAELMFYLPAKRAFYAAEEANATLHNLYTLRGAEVRDARLWSAYLDAALALIGDEADIVFGGHHWPRFGNTEVREYLAGQRDLYKYIHDQTLRLMNHGYTMREIPALIELPDALAKRWYNRGYYGTVSHNSRAVYQKYLGFYDGNPATLNPLPPAEAARRYVALAGGAEALLATAREAYDAGDYRWVAELVNHLVFAEPDNAAARELQAAALEQLGYQAESGPWRNVYLAGAWELRQGPRPAEAIRTVSPDLLAALSLDELFDYLAVRLNGPRAADESLSIEFEFTDGNTVMQLAVENGVLHHRRQPAGQAVDARIELTRGAFLGFAMAGMPLELFVDSGALQIDGDAEALPRLLSLLDNFDPWFPIVTP